MNTSVSVLLVEVLEDRTAVVVQYSDVTHLRHSDISCHETNPDDIHGVNDLVKVSDPGS